MSEPEDQLSGASELIAGMETMRGWRVTDGDVLVIGVDGDISSGTGEFMGLGSLSNMPVDGQRVDGNELQAHIDSITTQMSEQTRGVVLVTVADGGAGEAAGLQDDLVRAVGMSERSLPVAGEFVVDGDRDVWQIARNGLDVQTGDTTYRGRVPDAMPIVDDDGMMPNPVADRETVVSRVDPHPEPAFEALKPSDEMAIQLSSTLRSPGEVMSYGMRCLDGIAAGEKYTEQRMQVVAHLASTDMDFRDGFISHSIGDTKRMNALVETSRAAPDDQRAALQAAAAAARTLSNKPTPETRQLLDHAGQDPEQKTLVTLTRGVMSTGTVTERAEFGETVKHKMDPVFEARDKEWRADLERSRTSGLESSVSDPSPAAVRDAPGPGPDVG